MRITNAIIDFTHSLIAQQEVCKYSRMESELALIVTDTDTGCMYYKEVLPLEINAFHLSA